MGSALRNTPELRAELQDVIQVLKVAAGDLTTHVDNKTVVDGAANGRDWCCESRREAADLWRVLWDLLDELPDTVRIVKVNAHLGVRDVLSGRIHWQRWIGNGVADKWAKAGAWAAARQSPTATVHSQSTSAKAW